MFVVADKLGGEDKVEYLPVSYTPILSVGGGGDNSFREKSRNVTDYKRSDP